MRIKIYNWIIGFAVLTIIILLYSVYHSKSKYEDALSIMNYKDITIEQYKNDSSETVSVIEALQIDNLKMFKNTTSKDKTIATLRNIIENKESTNRRLESIILMYNELTVKYEDSITNLIVNTVEVETDSGIYVYPTYHRELDMFGKWIKGDVSLGLNTYKMNLSVYNDYEMLIYNKRNNIFSRFELYGELTNKNPYEKTRDLRLVNKTVDKGVYLTFGVIGGIDLNLKPIVGLGVSIPLFKVNLIPRIRKSEQL